MIQIGQKIDDLIDDFEFEVYQNDEIMKIKFSNYEGKCWFCCSTPRTLLYLPYGIGGGCRILRSVQKRRAEILSVSTDTVFVHKAWHDNSSSIAKIAYPMVADPTVRLCRYFGTYIEEVGLSLRGTFIIDPDGVLKAMDVVSKVTRIQH